MITIEKLKTNPQWVCWNSDVRDGKPTKTPKNPNNGKNAMTNDETTWSTYDVAVKAKSEFEFTGIGIMLANNVFGIDVDAIGHGTDNEVDNPIASEILDLFKDTYIERSPSVTCNNDRFLVDETGTRRFWIIQCSEYFDLDLLKTFNSVQLWEKINARGENYE